MIRSILLTLVALSLTLTTSSQQTDSLTTSKCDPSLRIKLHQLQRQRVATRGLENADETLDLVVTCRNATQFVRQMNRLGLRATAITNTVATAHVPAARISEVTALPTVVKISSPRPGKLRMDKARAGANIDAMHAGEGIESPFTGRGVILGIIDRGFEYTHPAFADNDGRLRIRAVWNRYNNDPEPMTDPEQIRQAAYDNTGNDHATHVTGIAGGTHLCENNLGGVAPDAELILLPSMLSSSEVLEDVRYIRDEAQKAGLPCVVNMSFGNNYGPHDGTDPFTMALDSLLGNGFLNVTAMGNEGHLRIHASGTIHSATDTLYIPVDQRDADEYVSLNIFSEARIATMPAVDFYLYDANRNTLIRALTDAEKEEVYIATDTTLLGKFYADIWYKMATPFLNDSCLLCMALSGGDAEQAYHSWCTDPGWGSFLSLPEDSRFIGGDHFYEGGGWCDSRRSLAIGAWGSKTSFHDLSGKLWNAYSIIENDIMYYSNYGPVVGDFAPKPLVCAPGGLISAPVAKEPDYFSPTNLNLTDVVERNGESFYYGAAQGTSMASPLVAGAIACWLQAYPELSPEEATEIIAQTAINDEFTGDARANWHLQWGYGKFDAYAGLKECIRRAKLNGVNAPLGEQPFTLSKSPDRWRVCFNLPVRKAVIDLYTADGRPLQRRILTNVTTAHEESIETAALPHGVYIIRLEADGVKQDRKFVR